MSVSKATAARRRAARVLRKVQIDLERAREAGTDVAVLLGAANQTAFIAWRRAINFAIERVREVRREERLDG